MASGECFVIFEGGGAKGITHLGALKALEQLSLKSIGFAGTSAGAIVAALKAVGYDADELFAPDGRTDVLSSKQKTPIDLLGISDWQIFKGLGSTAGGRSVASVFRWAVLLAPLLLLVWFFSLSRRIGRPPIARAAWRVIDDFGFFSTEGARDLLNEIIRDKLKETASDVPDLVCFRDIDPAKHSSCAALKIIATNLTQRRLDLFDSATKDVVVADAVAASFSIPIFFKPTRVRRVDAKGEVWVSEALYADGGLVSNLPVWAFSEDKRAVERVETNRNQRPLPIIAFTLGDDPNSSAGGKSPVGALTHFVAGVVRTGIFGGQALPQNFVPHLAVVNLPSDLSVTAFDCTRNEARLAYSKGRDSALEQLRRIFQTNPAGRTDGLREMIKLATTLSQTVRSSSGAGISQFRGCLVRRLGNLAFKVIGSVNMDDDADDDLILDQKNPGAPTAYIERDFTFVNVKQPGRDVVMTKYERALLRPGLQCLIAIPIFDDAAEWTKRPRLRSEPVGVFCLDSDSDLRLEYADRRFMTAMALESVRFAPYMTFTQERS